MDALRKKVLRREGAYTLLYPPLWLLSKLYCLGASVRNALYDWGILSSWEYPVPVVSVGNITAGGSGKTPLVESVYGYLEEAGFSPVIVAKGYRGKEKGPCWAGTDPKLYGDEGAVYALKGYRCVVSKKKFKGVSFALSQGAKSVVVDDGFQHRKVKPTLNIVAVDPFNPFGDGHCLPLGLLREPLRGFNRADAFVITRSNLVNPKRVESIELYLRSFKKPVFLAEQSFKGWVNEEFKPTQPPEGEVDLFCGIGNPSQFIKMVQSLGYKIRSVRVFNDHHTYTEEDLKELSRLRNPVTTEKDLIKLKGKLKGVKAPVLRLDAYGLKEFILANIKNVEKAPEEEVEGELAPSGISTYERLG